MWVNPRRLTSLSSCLTFPPAAVFAAVDAEDRQGEKDDENVPAALGPGDGEGPDAGDPWVD